MPLTKMDISKGMIPDLPYEDIAKAGGVYLANNCMPIGGKYTPIPSPKNWIDEALSGTPLKAIGVEGSDGVWHNFIGTTTKLYDITTTEITDVTRASGNYNATDWNFEVYGNWLIATNGVDAPQIIKDITLTHNNITSITSAGFTATVTTTANHGLSSTDNVRIEGATQTEYNGNYSITVTGVNTFTYTFAGSVTSPATGTITWIRIFQPLAGSPPTAKYCLMSHGHMIFANTTNDKKGIQWSALEDIEDYTISYTTGADTQTFPDISGNITGIASVGDNFVVASERSLVLGYYSGGVYRFNFRQNTIKNVGCFYPSSLVSSGDAVYFWSFDSIFKWDGNNLQEIGKYIKNYILNNINPNFPQKVQGIHYKSYGVIVWLYVSNNSDAYPDKLLIYNYLEDKFTTADLSAYTLWLGSTGFLSIDSLSDLIIDNCNLIIDSNYWTTGDFLPLLISTSDTKPKMLLGDSQTITIQTGEISETPNMLHIKKIYIPTEILTGTATVSVYNRYSKIDAYTVSTASTLKTDGSADLRTTNRRLAFYFQVTGVAGIGKEIELDITATGGR
jgi:hypothetical protein